MCSFCDNLTFRVEAIVLAIAEIILCFAAMIYVISKAYGIFTTLSIVLLLVLSLGATAGVCLLVGAVARLRVPVLIFIVLIFPVAVAICTIYGLELDERWNFIEDKNKAFGCIVIIAIAFLFVYMAYVSWQLLRELKAEEHMSV